MGDPLVTLLRQRTILFFANLVGFHSKPIRNFHLDHIMIKSDALLTQMGLAMCLLCVFTCEICKVMGAIWFRITLYNCYLKYQDPI